MKKVLLFTFCFIGVFFVFNSQHVSAASGPSVGKTYSTYDSNMPDNAIFGNCTVNSEVTSDSSSYYTKFGGGPWNNATENYDSKVTVILNTDLILDSPVKDYSSVFIKVPAQTTIQRNITLTTTESSQVTNRIGASLSATMGSSMKIDTVMSANSSVTSTVTTELAISNTVTHSASDTLIMPYNNTTNKTVFVNYQDRCIVDVYVVQYYQVNKNLLRKESNGGWGWWWFETYHYGPDTYTLLETFLCYDVTSTYSGWTKYRLNGSNFVYDDDRQEGITYLD